MKLKLLTLFVITFTSFGWSEIYTPQVCNESLEKLKKTTSELTKNLYELEEAIHENSGAVSLIDAIEKSIKAEQAFVKTLRNNYLRHCSKLNEKIYEEQDETNFIGAFFDGIAASRESFREEITTKYNAENVGCSSLKLNDSNNKFKTMCFGRRKAQVYACESSINELIKAVANQKVMRLESQSSDTSDSYDVLDKHSTVLEVCHNTKRFETFEHDEIFDINWILN